MLVMVTSDDGVAGKPFWEKNELLPCWIVERYLVGNAYKTEILKTELRYQDFPRIKAVDRNVSE